MEGARTKWGTVCMPAAVVDGNAGSRLSVGAHVGGVGGVGGDQLPLPLAAGNYDLREDRRTGRFEISRASVKHSTAARKSKPHA